MAGSKTSFLSGAPAGRLRFSPQRHLSPGLSCRDAGRPVLLPEGQDHLQSFARLSCQPSFRRPVGRGGGGGPCGAKPKHRGRGRFVAPPYYLVAFRGSVGASTSGAGAGSASGACDLDAAVVRRMFAHGGGGTPGSRHDVGVGGLARGIAGASWRPPAAARFRPSSQTPAATSGGPPTPNGA